MSKERTNDRRGQVQTSADEFESGNDFVLGVRITQRRNHKLAEGREGEGKRREEE
jgi:hypothetical protein